MDPDRQTLVLEAERLLKRVNDHLATAADSADERPNRPFHGEALRFGSTDEPPEVSEFETPWQTKAHDLKNETERLFNRLPPDANATGEERDSMLDVWPCSPEVLTAWRDEIAAVLARLRSGP